jgi:3-dehydroquinate dehydratase-2
MKIAIVNGPNLNLLGTREPEVYGQQSMQDIIDNIEAKYPSIEILYFQSNVEGEIINQLQALDLQKLDGIILNAGAYSHTSLAIADCVKSIHTSVIGIHMSNIYARETERHTDLLSAACIGGIYGFGAGSYYLAVESIVNKPT